MELITRQPLKKGYHSKLQHEKQRSGVQVTRQYCTIFIPLTYSYSLLVINSSKAFHFQLLGKFGEDIVNEGQRLEMKLCVWGSVDKQGAWSPYTSSHCGQEIHLNPQHDTTNLLFLVSIHICVL